MNPVHHTKFPLLYVAISMIVAIVLVVECSARTAWIVVGVAIVCGLVVELVTKRAEVLVLSLFALASLLLTRAALPHDVPPAFDVRYQAIAVAKQDLAPNKKWDRTAVELIALRDSATQWREIGTVAQLNVDTALRLSAKRGDTIAFGGYFRQISGSYGKQLAKQGIAGQFYTYRASVVGSSDTTFWDRVNGVRRSAAARIAMIDTSSSTATATLAAITVGLRSDMDRQTVVDYRRSGVAHLLAISGLHIGMIVALLNLLLIAIRPWSRTTRVVYSVLIILMLWSYAVFCGMSPSVLRAVVMFTLYQIATMIYRDGTSLNVLSAAAVILLLVDPLYLYDLGFQLSFVAMAGIATLYRPISALWRVENRFLRGVWGAVVVALAAQVAVLPLSIYYFGYLPWLGLPVGLLLWAFVPVMIVCTLLFLFTSWVWIGQIGVWAAKIQNNLLGVVSDQRWVVAEDLTLPLWALILIYVVMIGVVVWINYRSRRHLRRDVLSSTYNI